MVEKIEKVAVLNQDLVLHQTNNVTIVEGQKTQRVYSSPLPDCSLFQGRKAELEELYGWLQDGTTSMIGVRGEGGIGKSTLVAKVFDECQGFVGKCWIDVRTGTNITELTERALQEFGMPPEQMQAIDKKDLPQRLLRQLQIERYLLAIDNLELILSQEGKWQSGYEEFLDTFFELGGKSVLLLAGREYPPKYFGWRRSQWLTVDRGLESTEGAALLKALEAEGEEDERAKVSQQVDGNPLALSLLAGWLRQEFRPGERSVLHLDQQPYLFEVEGKHRGENQVSLQCVFDWSFNRLSSEAQFLLSQVSVLRGSFNREAASALVQQALEDAKLQDFERRSLLQELPGVDKYGLKQYQLQPRVQDFTQKKAGDLTAAHERAIHYYWEHRTLEFNPNDDQEAASAHLATFYHAFTLEWYQTSAQIVFDCDKFLSIRGYFQLLVSQYLLLHNYWQPTSDQYQDYTSLCYNLGFAHSSLGEYQQARNYYEQALAIYREIGDRQGEAIVLKALGFAHSSLGEYQQARNYY
ncbi:NB-ARC domain-containing protein, partial [uncultured Nostoc sp.]